MKYQISTFICAGVLSLISVNQLTAQTLTLIPASDANILYTGRVDQSNPNKVSHPTHRIEVIGINCCF